MVAGLQGHDAGRGEILDDGSRTARDQPAVSQIAQKVRSLIENSFQDETRSRRAFGERFTR